jgi:hypothetical protein
MTLAALDKAAPIIIPGRGSPSPYFQRFWQNIGIGPDLDWDAPITDPAGRVTPYFQRFWQNLALPGAKLDKSAPIVDPKTGRITPYFQRFWQNLVAALP